MPKVGESAVCAHCGLKVLPHLVRPNDDKQFCCSGCRQVYAILNECGLEQYYNLREMEDAKPQSANVSGRGFEDFDDPSFTSKYVKKISETNNTVILYLEGIHCAACVWLVENLPRTNKGLLSIRLDMARAQAVIDWDPSQISLSAIARSLDRVGYLPHPYNLSDVGRLRKEEGRDMLKRLGLATACAINIMVIQAALYAGEYSGIDPRFESFFRWISFLLAIPVVVYSARTFFTAAAGGLMQKVPHMDLPISIAILVGFSYSAVSTIKGFGHIYFDSITALVALLLAGRYIQFQVQRSAMDLSERMRGSTLPDFARKKDQEGNYVETPTDTLKAGDHVEVLVGETIPVDGVIVKGVSEVNNAALTGEAEPLKLESGMPVHAGSINLGSRLEIVTQATGDLTRVGSLMQLVNQAFQKRAPIVQLVDRISKYFVVIVLLLAVLTAMLWSDQPTEIILERVIALLVITCPCALGLATPVAVSVSLSMATKMGIYIKRADVIEHMKSIRRVFIDKTGTITTGEMSVLKFDGNKKEAALVHALESNSNHPIAEALLKALADFADRTLLVESFEEAPGLGIHGVVDGHHVVIGNMRLMEKLEIQWPYIENSNLQKKSKNILTNIYIAIDNTPVTKVVVGDPLRPEALQIVERLKRENWKIDLVSGDHHAAVSRVASLLGLDEDSTHAGVTPEEKLELVNDTMGKNENSGLLMIGDGVNDAAALAASSVGVAVHGGSGASAQAADVVFTRSGLKPLVSLISGTRRTMFVIYRNLLFSLLYNIVGAYLAISGIVDPLFAAVLMPISSLTVILSSILGQSYIRDNRKSPV